MMFPYEKEVLTIMLGSKLSSPILQKIERK